MNNINLSSPADKILFFLKTKGPQTAKQMAAQLEVTTMAVRQHLYTLEKESFISHFDKPAKVGRPTRHWEITEKAASKFPDNHSELVVDLIQSMRCVFGNEGVDQLVEKRTNQSIESYRNVMEQKGGSLEDKVAALAEIRSNEGYMAEYKKENGKFILWENHCPICRAAQLCQGFCRQELRLFQEVLGKEIQVERTEHIQSGDRRCVYEIKKIVTS